MGSEPSSIHSSIASAATFTPTVNVAPMASVASARWMVVSWANRHASAQRCAPLTWRSSCATISSQ